MINNIAERNALWNVIKNTSNSTSNWMIYFLIILITLIAIIFAIAMIRLCWNDIELYFWNKKWEKEHKK